VIKFWNVVILVVAQEVKKNACHVYIKGVWTRWKKKRNHIQILMIIATFAGVLQLVNSLVSSLVVGMFIMLNV